MKDTVPCPPLVRQPQPGSRIGHYRVEELISSGGFGTVYRVTRNGTSFALKLPLACGPLAQSGEGESHAQRTVEQRIIREVVSLMTLSHPNIVRVHGFDRWPGPTGALYLVMDFVDGVPLLQWRRNESPTLREVVRLFQTLALALDEVHRLGVVHRDIKSSNVLVAQQTDYGTGNWKPVLVDFGLARPAFTTDVTREHTLVGTEGLWAPEVVRAAIDPPQTAPAHRFTAASDLHSLGLLFYEALTGQPALRISGNNLTAVLNELPRPPSTVCASLPKALDAAVLRLLAKSPDERTGSGAQLANELEPLLADGDRRWNSTLPTMAVLAGEGDGTTRSEASRPTRRRLTAARPASSAVATLPTTTAHSDVHTREVPRTTIPILEPIRRTPTRPAHSARWLGLSAAVITLLAGSFAGRWAAQRVNAPLTAAPALNRVPVAAPATIVTVVSKPTAPPVALKSVTAATEPPQVIRADIAGPIRPGAIEAVLNEPLLSRGRVVLPVGTRVLGSAATTPDGSFALVFQTAISRSGEKSAVEAGAQLDARAGLRQPLRKGATPLQLEFDLKVRAPNLREAAPSASSAGGNKEARR